MAGEASLTHRDSTSEMRCEPNQRDTSKQGTIERMSPMGLLPCLRRGSDRWWLPRSYVATEAIGHLLLASGRGQIDDRTRQRIVAALKSDPPLLIYAALCSSGDCVEADDLADWLTQHATGRFASGDAFLGAPPLSYDVQRRWNKLRDHYRTIPISQWLDDAPLWLEVTGPCVSNTWREQWPKVVDSVNESTDSFETANDCMLQQLARMMQRQHSLEQSFDQRLQKSKLGALKQLAYGLSHEINNPLANISTRAQQLQRSEQDPTRSAILQRIVDQVYRAHEMIADLMFYANPPLASRQRCDLNQTLVTVAASFQEESKRQAIRMEVKTPPEATFVVVDEKMIEEALRALIRNSIDAVGCQGTVVVSLVRQEQQLMIHVADSGPGLSERARKHAFDPYFSGREAGRGLGLGLCRAYRIAKLHFGDISLAGGPIGCVATIRLNNFP